LVIAPAGRQITQTEGGAKMWILIVGLLGDIALPLAFVGWSAYGFVVFAIPAVSGMG